MPTGEALRMLGLDAVRGEGLALADYREDFRLRQWTIDGQDSWKFERGQQFEEPGFDSWEAFARGEWDEALRLIEAEREYLLEFQQENARRGTSLWRVRVVEEPVTPYVHWELHLLRLRAECGERIRVIGAGAVADLETTGVLPELVTLGKATTYQVLYSEQGLLDGAVRFEDPAVTSRCCAFIQRLYAFGEDVGSYVERAVASLPPPAAGRR